MGRPEERPSGTETEAEVRRQEGEKQRQEADQPPPHGTDPLHEGP